MTLFFSQRAAIRSSCRASSCCREKVARYARSPVSTGGLGVPSMESRTTDHRPGGAVRFASVITVGRTQPRLTISTHDNICLKRCWALYRRHHDDASVAADVGHIRAHHHPDSELFCLLNQYTMIIRSMDDTERVLARLTMGKNDALLAAKGRNVRSK